MAHLRRTSSFHVDPGQATTLQQVIASKRSSISSSFQGSEFDAKVKQRSGDDYIVKPTLKRYIVLLLFCVNSGNKAYQWIQIPASTKKLTYYYDVDVYVINTLSVLFMVSFIVLSWPACYIIERIGLRWAVLVGAFGTAVGSVIKCFSCNEGGILILFLAQIIVSLSEQFIFSVPSRLSSVWFPDHQVSIAVAMSILGNQLGVALGFMIPQFLLDSAETKDEISAGLYKMFVGTAILSVISFLCDTLLFDEAPRHPPGTARMKQIEEEKANMLNKPSFKEEMSTLWHHTVKLLKNPGYLGLSQSYGVMTGLGYAISTLLNQMLESVYPGDDILIGWTGFIIILFGALFSPIWGRCLDSSHRYLFANIGINLGTMASLVIFGVAIVYIKSKTAIYAAAAFMGLFQTGAIIAGLELAVELTYPSPELITSSILNIMPQIWGSIFVYIGSFIVDSYGVTVANVFFVICLTGSLIILLNTKENLYRQNAVHEGHQKAKKGAISGSAISNSLELTGTKQSAMIDVDLGPK